MTEIDAPKEECGVVAIFSSQLNSSRLAFFSLFALQHRGQESAGIATSNNGIIKIMTLDKSTESVLQNVTYLMTITKNNEILFTNYFFAEDQLIIHLNDKTDDKMKIFGERKYVKFGILHFIAVVSIFFVPFIDDIRKIHFISLLLV